jgi:hypothetical protein
MSLKESSDELNSPEIVSEVVDRAHPARGLADDSPLAIATFGVGYLPVAPGTWGSSGRSRSLSGSSLCST